MMKRIVEEDSRKIKRRGTAENINLQRNQKSPNLDAEDQRYYLQYTTSIHFLVFCIKLLLLLTVYLLKCINVLILQYFALQLHSRFYTPKKTLGTLYIS